MEYVEITIRFWRMSNETEEELVEKVVKHLEDDGWTEGSTMQIAAIHSVE